jgi:hypothetical protein
MYIYFFSLIYNSCNNTEIITQIKENLIKFGTGIKKKAIATQKDVHPQQDNSLPMNSLFIVRNSLKLLSILDEHKTHTIPSTAIISRIICLLIHLM